MEDSKKEKKSMMDEYEKEKIKSHLELQDEVEIDIRTVEGLFRTLALSNDAYRDKVSDERLPSEEQVENAKHWVDENEL